jgi:hypothetical protein
MVNIRAHHFVCMQGFQGYGYSDVFVKRMNEMVKYIKENPKDKIRIVNYCDEICSMCKNNTNGICESWEDVNCMDKKLLSRLNLKNEQEVIIEDIINLVEQEFKSFQDAYHICGNCSWSEKCLWILKFSRGYEKNN